ncbi:hypothetical protein FB45DRAFT_503176 [Roridomyces roridus]|uniref:Uncharacterized protein n=1 Tax=Roridomyces roridus TaxID=1738132 RepID=A0AAD7BWE3_9AGAR|nr:hypothetical protein FB45DRAFT_503176 [Roridomyces roridus]
MGSSPSKATRTLPKRVSKNLPWTGARVAPTEAASETKNQAIKQDAMDPQFLSKLSQLGPVKVDHHMQAVRPATLATRRMFDSQLQSESEAAAAVQAPNRLHAPTLSRLLDERKSIRTPRDMEYLAKRFGIDIDKLEAVARYVSTPSVDPRTAVRVTGKDGDSSQVLRAVWVEPRLKM